MSDTYRVEVGPKGRVVIPAPLRRELGLHEGAELAAFADGGGVVLLPKADVKRRLREMFHGTSSSLAEELMRERRAEAEAESGR